MRARAQLDVIAARRQGLRERKRRRGVTLDAEMLCSRRLELGLTQQDAAQLGQISMRTLQSADRGHRVAVTTARVLARALNLPYHTLVRPSDETIRTSLAESGFTVLPPPSPFVGRESATRQALAVLGEGRQRAVCVLAGPTGIGKTALARHVARRLEECYVEPPIRVKCGTRAAARALHPGRRLPASARWGAE